MQPASHLGLDPMLLGQILIREAGVSEDALQTALEKQLSEKRKIGELLVEADVINDLQLAKALATQQYLEVVAELPPADELDLSLIEPIPITFAKAHKLVPFAIEESGRIRVAIVDPLALDGIDDVSVLLQTRVVPVVAPEGKLTEFINKVYGRLRAGAELEGEGREDTDFNSEELVDLLDVNDEAPIIRWVNSLLFQAAKEKASDIHIEPGEKEVAVRFRRDGALHMHNTAPKKFLPSIITRVKIMAGLNIAEKRLPQDGRIRRKIGGKDIDMRVATVPTAAGERVTIRLLDRSSVLLGLGDIGMSEDTLEEVRKIIKRPHGILLVTGPTGSGKTTTLYACLSEIKSPELNILTAEDPVEYQLDGISQVQVNSKIDFTFASALRSFLRHDPDVVMVGEIRDKETAEIAITASLTGHFVFSTIHTNDAAGGVTRLVDMGIEPFLVASSLVGLLAQRLVRRPCYDCCEEVVPDTEILEELGLDPERFLRGEIKPPNVIGMRPVTPGKVLRAVGCKACQNLGYRGRTGIYELLLIDDPVRKLTLEKSDATALKQSGMQRGMITLRMDGARKVMQGLTTPEEVLLVTAEREEMH